jgi:hypothetical protein
MTKRLTIILTEELHRSLKIYCAYNDVTLSQVATKALRDFVKNHAELIEKLSKYDFE